MSSDLPKPESFWVVRVRKLVRVLAIQNSFAQVFYRKISDYGCYFLNFGSRNRTFQPFFVFRLGRRRSQRESGA